MNQQNTPRVFIFSAERSEMDPNENATRTGQLTFALEHEGIPYQLAEGNYRGVSESSFVVSGARHQDKVFALAAEFEQDSVLVVAENDRTAYLVDTEGGPWRHLGIFEQAPERVAKTQDHTVVGFSCYIVRKTNGPDLPEGI